MNKFWSYYLTYIALGILTMIGVGIGGPLMFLFFGPPAAYTAVLSIYFAIVEDD